jgi:spermidine synthase
MDEKPVATLRSKFQEIAIYRSQHYGKVLMLDGVVQLTEKDANSYNEMMAHPAMFSHPNPKRVLVIGGGDGYVVSEVSTL